MTNELTNGKTEEINESRNVWVVRDNQGRYNGSVFMGRKDLDSKEQVWSYFSYAFPTSWNMFRENAEIDLAIIKAINELAGFNLTFKVVELTEDEIRNLRNDYLSNNKERHYSLVDKEIKRGTICKSRKAIHDICKSYKGKKRRIA